MFCTQIWRFSTPFWSYNWKPIDLEEVWIRVAFVHLRFFFFFFSSCCSTHFIGQRLLFMYYSWIVATTFDYFNLQISLFSNFFIKNGSHSTIHTFKNYFATVFSVFNFQFQQNKFYLNGPLVIKRNCCIQSTTIADLNFWMKISKSQTREFVCNNFTIIKSMNSELRVVTPVSTTWGSNRWV